MSDTLVVNEIYLSLQGESTYAGLPCIFVRLTACNLRCSYCDTAYAFTEGRKMTLAQVAEEIHRLAGPFANGTVSNACSFPSPENDLATNESRSARTVRLPLIELTGGEPLLQPNSLPLMKSCCDAGFTVLLETSGAHDLAPVDRRVHCIMDLKCPSSGEVLRNRWENIRQLKSIDEIKFVIGTSEDYEWARQKIAEHKLAEICPLLFSWVSPLAPAQQHPSLKPVPSGQHPISRQELAEKIIAYALPVRFQVQMHKVIWSPEARGV